MYAIRRRNTPSENNYNIIFWISDFESSLFVYSASEMTYIVSSGALNSTHSLTHPVVYVAYTSKVATKWFHFQFSDVVRCTPRITAAADKLDNNKNNSRVRLINLTPAIT